MKCEYGTLVELNRYRETEVRGDKPVLVSGFTNTNSKWNGVRSNLLFIFCQSKVCTRYVGYRGTGKTPYN
jgi:hypothetical protein